MEKQTIMKQLNDINKMINGGHIEEAIHLLNQLVSTSSPPDDRLFYMRGNAYRKKGDFQQALNNYMEAISLNPQSPAIEAYQMLTNILDFHHKDLYNP